MDQLAFYKKAHKVDREYQVWQEGIQPKLIQNDAMMKDKIEYIHNNPVKRGYVDEAQHWRYSSARDYEGLKGLLDFGLMYAFPRKSWERGKILKNKV